MPDLARRLQPQARLSECGHDSIDLVELLCVAENDYGVRLTVEEVIELKTVQDFITLIDRRATKRPPSP
jgi:acyl carrier protein